jgi:hypothetical protein
MDMNSSSFLKNVGSALPCRKIHGMNHAGRLLDCDPSEAWKTLAFGQTAPLHGLLRFVNIDYFACPFLFSGMPVAVSDDNVTA